MSRAKDCCVGEPFMGDPGGLHSQDCPVYQANCEYFLRLHRELAAAPPLASKSTPALPTGSTSAQLRQTQTALAASQADLTAALDKARALKVALIATRAELATAQQELARLRNQLGTPLRTEETPMSDWKRSSYCGTNACVEVAVQPDGSARVRDSKHPERQPLDFDAEAWADFVAGVQAGEFGGETP